MENSNCEQLHIPQLGILHNTHMWTVIVISRLQMCFIFYCYIANSLLFSVVSIIPRRRDLAVLSELGKLITIGVQEVEEKNYHNHINW